MYHIKYILLVFFLLTKLFQVSLEKFRAAIKEIIRLRSETLKYLLTGQHYHV